MYTTVQGAAAAATVFKGMGRGWEEAGEEQRQENKHLGAARAGVPRLTPGQTPKPSVLQLLPIPSSEGTRSEPSGTLHGSYRLRRCDLFPTVTGAFSWLPCIYDSRVLVLFYQLQWREKCLERDLKGLCTPKKCRCLPAEPSSPEMARIVSVSYRPQRDQIR